MRILGLVSLKVSHVAKNRISSRLALRRISAHEAERRGAYEGVRGPHFIGAGYASFKGSYMPADVKLNFRLAGGSVFYHNFAKAYQESLYDLGADSAVWGGWRGRRENFLRNVG